MGRVRAARMLTDFDSSVNMVRAISRFLRGKDHRAMSMGPGSPMLAGAASAAPSPLRRATFTTMGRIQGVPLNQARQVRADELTEWVTRQYGPGPYPAVIVGSASGAAVFLAAALRAPFLPQSLLVALRDTATHPDDPVGAMHAVAPLARMVAANNPELAVYHMHDPAQDRPMLENMAYLRLKRLRLGPVYERFLQQRLAPGATVIQLECTRDWRSRQVGERTYFQFGCLDGLSEEEYHHGGQRIADYLARENSSRWGWDPPEPDGRRPEAEWGFDPAIAGDIEAVAARNGYALHRLTMAEPQELSPFVADLYRWWYRDRGMPAARLLAQSYVQWDPMWTLRLGAVPFWLRFNTRPSYADLSRYLDGAEPYGRIHLNLFSQGLWSPGVVSIEQWHRLITAHAREHAQIIGVDTGAYPSDTGGTLRYQPAFAALPPRYPLPAPLTMADIDRFGWP
ncbi:MAG: hypothetical protein M0026_20745 [Nocardiopsaceae bacterium]|nr:hypothetical protein [Nocardiopsaceae bacterium]